MKHPYNCLGVPDLELGKLKREPYKPLTKIDDEHLEKMKAKQLLLAKKERKIEEMKSKKKEFEDNINELKKKHSKSQPTLLHIRNVLIDTGYNELSKVVNESKRRVKNIKSGASLPDLKLPPISGPYLPPELKEFRTDCAENTSTKYFPPIPMYISSNTLKKKKCPLFLYSLPNYADIINNKKIFKIYDEYPTIDILDNIINSCPIIGLYNKWVYNNIDVLYF